MQLLLLLLSAAFVCAQLPPANSVEHQNFDVTPPFPILEIGMKYILSQTGSNATRAENDSIAREAVARHSSIVSRHLPGALSSFLALSKRDGPAECGPRMPCVDGSCCNSEGKCGFTPYNCNTTAQTTCISNCDAHAMCGVDSLYGEQKCPLNLCCSYFGYCGTSNLHCGSSDAAGVRTPCQEGYGSCHIIQPPTCGSGCVSASQGRKVAWYQVGNVYWRSCNRVTPAQIDTTGLTHLILAFAAIDPKTFEVVASDQRDYLVYPKFTALKTARLQTWIGLGGYDFSDPGPTHTTWSDLVGNPSNRAAFIFSLIRFMNKWGFQGVDLDWEYPSRVDRGGKASDAADLVSLVRELRTAFGSKFGLSTVLPTDYQNVAGNDPVGMSPYVDFFNYMAYDMHGPWEAKTLGAFIRAQTSITDVDSRLSLLWFDGVPPDKINLGIAYYGRGFTVSDTSCMEIGCPYVNGNRAGVCTRSSGVLSLREIQQIIQQKGLRPKLLPDLMVKQITWDNQWIGYDDSETYALKMKWADSHCLGGTAGWSIDFNSGAGSGDTPLQLSTDGSCGNGHFCNGSKFGDCCSQHGFCGSSVGFCSTRAGCQIEYGSCHQDQPGIQISVDGSCGNDITCTGSPFGKCCSKSNFCGSSQAHCSPTLGCQARFGICVDGNLGNLAVSKTGQCGKGVTCKGSGFGECCSEHGYCGSKIAYCDGGAGCQPEFGTCQ